MMRSIEDRIFIFMDNKIGFIGLGQMGKWMALNVTKKGFDVTVADIDHRAVKFVTKSGADTADTPSEIAAQTDWIFLCLPDATVVENVIFGKSGLTESLRPGQIVVDMGTTAYMASLEFATRLQKKQVSYADAPVSGMQARAKEGSLTVMFGGPQEIFKQIMPVLRAVGNNILHMGATGCGQLTKLINQLLFNINAASIAEILPMAVKLGLDPEKVLTVVNTGTGRSFASDFFGPRALEGNYSEGYALNSAYKDMVSAAEICAREKIPMPMVHAATTTYQMALAEGHGDKDKGAMIKVFERILGVQFRKKG